MNNNRGERDRSIEALLRRQREDVADSPATEQCIDAETLAAWIDGGLAGEDLAAAERHSAGCARCQAMLASMARIAPSIPSSRPWWRSATVRWVAPVAAAATALALWVSVDRQRNPAATPVTPAAASRAAEPVAPPALPSDKQERLSAIQNQEAQAPSAKAAASIDAVARRESPPGFAARGGVGGGQTSGAIRPTLQARRDNAASVATQAAATPAPAPSAQPAPPPPTAGPVAGNAAPPTAVDALKPTPIAETVTVTAESSTVARMAAGRAGGGAAFTTTDILSSEPAFRWRIGAPGVILRSTDGGATWTSQRTSVPVALAAGSAPARDVCWIVGRSGAVLLSTDGTTWLLRPFPEAVNLTAVRAVDSKTAVVTTADGRQFSTADGGATWSKLPVQESPIRPF